MKYDKQPKWVLADSKEIIMFSDEFIEDLLLSFPDVDVMVQLEKAHSFAIKKPDPFYKKGLPTFIYRWMQRNQDREDAFAAKLVVVKDEP